MLHFLKKFKKKYNKKFKIKRDNFSYSAEDICPCCGVYTVNGSVCSKCLSEFNLGKNKI